MLISEGWGGMETCLRKSFKTKCLKFEVGIVQNCAVIWRLLDCQQRSGSERVVLSVGEVSSTTKEEVSSTPTWDFQLVWLVPLRVRVRSNRIMSLSPVTGFLGQKRNSSSTRVWKSGYCAPVPASFIKLLESKAGFMKLYDCRTHVEAAAASCAVIWRRLW